MSDDPPPLPPKQRISFRYSKEDEAKAIREEELVLKKIHEERHHSSQSLNTYFDEENLSGFYRTHSAVHTGDNREGTLELNIGKQLQNLQHVLNVDATTTNESSTTKNSTDLMSFSSPEKGKEDSRSILDQIKNLNVIQPSSLQLNFGYISKVPIPSPRSTQFALNTAQNNTETVVPSQRSSLFAGNNNNNDQSLNSLYKMCGSTITKLTNVNLLNISAKINSKDDVNVTNPKNKSNLCLPKGPPAKSKTVTGTTAAGFSNDLIDLGGSSNKYGVNLHSSILDDFDPLTAKVSVQCHELPMTQHFAGISNEARELLRYKELTTDNSYYGQVDPFEYMHASAGSTRSDPVIDIYDGLGSPGALSPECFDIPPPLPSRFLSKKDKSLPSTRESSPIHTSQIVPSNESDGLLKIWLKKTPTLSVDPEAQAFWNKIKKLRSEYTHEDHIGNPGLLHSPCLESSVDLSLSVKLLVYYKDRDPALFTCHLNASTEHVVMQSMVTLNLVGNCKDYILKVRGADEYLCGESILADYEYVHLCVKHDKDISFSLILTEEVKRSYLRTEEDDKAIDEVPVGSLLPVGSEDAAHYNDLSIALDAFHRELSKIKVAGFQLLEGTPVQDLSSIMRSRPLRGIVKQICALLGEWETVELCNALLCFINTCRSVQKSQGVLDGEDDATGRMRMLCTGSSEDSLPPEDLKDCLVKSLNEIVVAVRSFLLMYIRAFRVDLQISNFEKVQDEPTQEASATFSKVNLQILGIHRMNRIQTYDEYFVEVQLYHGSSCVGIPALSRSVKESEDNRFYPRIVFNEWLDLGMRVNALPRESRLVFTIFGLKVIPSENKSDPLKYEREPIGWAAIQMFSYNGWMSQGNFLMTLWPMESNRLLPPAPYSYDHPHANLCPILTVRVTDLPYKVFYPRVVPQTPNLLEFKDLDISTQHQLLDIIERDIFTFTDKTSVEEKEILWEKRHYLHNEPSALAMVLLATRSWEASILPDIHSLVVHWSHPTSSSDALHLLLPCFPDTIVRNKAVDWMRNLGSDELIAYLPQLVQAVKHEAWDVSDLISFLLERALTSPRLAHHLYWLLNQCLPQQTNAGGEQVILTDARYRRRLNLVTRALMTICGKNLENRLLRQEAVLWTLHQTALTIKNEKDSYRLKVLHRDLKYINENLQDLPTSLPLSPSLEVAGIDIDSCSYYTSFTVPLRLVFRSSEVDTHHIHTIFKVGDDLRQDMLVIQMIRLMDKLWLKEGLDLRIVTFNIVPTGDRIGILEMIRDAETLGKIHNECGLTGPFKDRIIADWLAKQNPSQLEYHRAVVNFTASCAGYCVATYILGICDRHNDNIMLKTSGHMFHIDFGKFLGDAQKFGNFKRDRTPFVLTGDMAYVINGGEKPSDKFQSFVDLCCKAFNVIRSNGHLILYLFALMASSGIPGVTKHAVEYVGRALMQEKTNAEAGAFFAKMIQQSLGSWFTTVNFFIHILAQRRFLGESQESDGLLSFVPRTYSLTEDGRITRATLFNSQKRYNPEKCYVYILEVSRKDQKEPTYLFRCYREFSEFHQKLCYLYPLALIHSLPKGAKIRRSEVKAVAEKRENDINLFLKSLFSLADEISHSDLVYTFFHPLLRDQEDTDIHIKKLKCKEMKNTSDITTEVQGKVKVSLQYVGRELQIMVHHARNLAATSAGAPEPSPYVKLYLLPDPHKRTKRKTKVVKKSCHPTYMEMITYRMSLEVIYTKILEISVWSEDVFADNVYLGSAYLRLSDYDCTKETCEWLPLKHNIKTAREHILSLWS